MHLELVTDLSTAALRSKGSPLHIWSHNTTNFVGASKAINELITFFSNFKDEIIQSGVDSKIDWHFSSQILSILELKCQKAFISSSR